MRARALLAAVALLGLLLAPLAGEAVVAEPVEGFYHRGSSGFRSAVFYYGWLTTSNLLELDFDILVVAGSERVLPGGEDRSIVEELLARGVEVYAYLHDNSAGGVPVGLGSLYQRMVVEEGRPLEEYVSYLKGLVAQYRGALTGVFLDECDPAYFGTTDPGSPHVANFTRALQEIVEYAHSLGLRVFINGVRAYAGLGDYYLWESFLTVPDPGTGRFVIYDGFLSEENTNPYSWAGGAAKLEYLREHGLLDRTIALTLVSRGDLRLAEAGYYAARILGLAGWAYAWPDIFARGGPVPESHAYPLGPAIGEPIVDTEGNRLERLFLAGPAGVNLSTGSYWTPYDGRPWTPYLDGSRDPWYVEAGGPWSGPSSSIESAALFASWSGVYLHLDLGFTGEPSGGFLHIYLDTDGDPATGFQAHGVGADLLVEAYTGGSATLYRYTGTGADWSWEPLAGAALNITLQDGWARASVEIALPPLPESTALVLATVVSWSDDAVSTPQALPPPVQTPPTVYTPRGAPVPMVVETRTLGRAIVVVADAPAGTLARYTLALPWEPARALADNRPLPRVETLPGEGEAYTVEPGEGHYRVTVQVSHGSPVVIALVPPGSVGGVLTTPQASHATWPALLAAAALLLLGALPALARKARSPSRPSRPPP